MSSEEQYGRPMSESERRYLEDQQQGNDRDRHNRPRRRRDDDGHRRGSGGGRRSRGREGDYHRSDRQTYGGGGDHDGPYNHYGNSEGEERRRQDRDRYRERERGRSRERRADDYNDYRGRDWRSSRPRSRSSSRDDSYYGGDRGGMAAATPSSGYASSNGGWGEYGYGDGVTGTHAPGTGGAADGDGGAVASASSNWVDDHRHPSGYHSSHSMSSYHSGYHSSQSVTGTWGAGEYDAKRSRGRDRRVRSRSPSISADDRSRDYSRERAGGGGSRSRDSSRERGRSSRSGDDGAGAGAGRKRSRDETAAASFSPLVHDSGVKDTSRRRRDRFRRQLIDRTPFDVLSDPDYVSAVCGKAVEGDAARRILPHLLDAMGMEIVQQQTLTPKIPSQIGGIKETGDKIIDTETMDAMNVSVRPKKKNPDNTPGTVREFALAQVDVRSSLVDSSTEKEHGANVLDEIFAAFRIAAHHTIVYADEALGDLSSTSIPADREQKIADIARRALMTCFVTFRGLLLQLAESADEERSKGKTRGTGSIGVIFGEGFEGRADIDGAPSAVEGVLLDIVPLLTQFFHPPLGEKRASSLLQNLLSLDETARKKKRSSKVDKKRQMSQVEISEDDLLAEQIYTVIARDSLMEVFVRQLLEQEGEAKRKLGKELLNITTSGAVSKTDVGAVAALRTKITCPEVRDVIAAHRNSQGEEMERWRRIAEAQNDGPSWDHEYQPFASSKKKRVSPRNSTDVVKEDLNLLRLDGCIYLSRIAARIFVKGSAKSSSVAKGATKGKDESQEGSKATDSLTPTPQQSLQTPAMTPSSTKGGLGDGLIEGKQEGESSVPTEVELASARPQLSLENAAYERDRLTGGDVQAQRERIYSLAFFLFHTLMDHYARAESEGYSKSTSIRREDIPSASLACYLLAGKMEECPVKVRTLLNLIKSVGLPPPPSTRIDKCCKRLKDIVELNDSSTSAKRLSLEWGKPTPEVMKQYELKLLSILGFDFLYGEGYIHPSTSIDELAEILSLDSDAVDHVKSVMNDSSYTHSSLCLLGQPKLITAAMYYLSCDKTERELHEQWDELLDEDEELVKLVANYAWEVRNSTRAREKQWQAFVELKTNFDAIRQSVQSHSSRQESQSSEAGSSIPSLDELNVDTTAYDCFTPPQPLTTIVGAINAYLAELGHPDGPSLDESAVPADIEEGSATMSETNDSLPIQDLQIPDNSRAMDITPSMGQTQGNESGVVVEDADDGSTNAKAQTLNADDGNTVEAEGACGADTCTTGSVKLKERSPQKEENCADKNIAADGDEETTAVKMVSSGAGATEEAGSASTKSIPSECVNGSLTSTKSATPEASKSQEAKSPIASTPNPPVHSLKTPAIMSEQSKSSNSSTTSDKAKAAMNKLLDMTVTSKRGRDTCGNDQEPNEESQSKRRMLKMPISRPNLTVLVPKKETVPSQPPPSQKPQSQSFSLSSKESANTSSHSQPSEQQASPRQSKRKQRPSPVGKNGRTAESSPQTASQQTKRKSQSPREQPTSNERSKLQSSPDTKKRKANESVLAQAQSSPTTRRPKMRFGQAAFAGMMNHLGMSGGGTSTKQMSKREDGGKGEYISSLPTFDDSESPRSPKQRASPEETAARSKAKPNKNNRKGSKGADVGSVTYHFTIDNNDSPSPRGRGRAAQNSTKPKPSKDNKKEEHKGADVGSVTYHFTIDDDVSPSPRGRGRATAQNSSKPKPNNKKSKGQRNKKRN